MNWNWWEIRCSLLFVLLNVLFLNMKGVKTINGFCYKNVNYVHLKLTEAASDHTIIRDVKRHKGCVKHFKVHLGWPDSAASECVMALWGRKRFLSHKWSIFEKSGLFNSPFSDRFTSHSSRRGQGLCLIVSPSSQHSSRSCSTPAASSEPGCVRHLLSKVCG